MDREVQILDAVIAMADELFASVREKFKNKPSPLAGFPACCGRTE